MDHEANPYRDPTDSDTRPAPPTGGRTPRWKVPRTALTVGLTAFLGMAGAGAAFAVSGTDSSTPARSAPASGSGSGSGSAPTGPGPAGGRVHGPRGGLGPMGPGLGGVLHGVFTTRNGTGFKTVEIQVGSVQPGNSSTSITVKSADGYSQSYSVESSTVVNSQAGGITSVRPGDKVRVEAVQQGSGYTATDIVDTTQIGSSRHGFGFVPPGGPGPGSVQPGSST